MTTELATRKAEVAFGNTPNGLDDAWRLATAIQKSGLAPQSFKTAESILVAMQYGAELGMKPMQSLQGIAVINGKPSLYGDALMALVLDSEKCEYIHESVEGTGDNMKAVCVSKRKDQPKERVSTFSVADAKKASLWGKGGPWSQYPQRMLTMRARAFNLRDNFADVLRGMSVVEEVRDIPQEPTGGKTLSFQEKPYEEIAGEVVPEAPETDLPAVPDYDGLTEQLGNCNTPSDVDEIAAMYPNDDYWQQQCGLRTKEMMKTGKDLF